MILCGDDYCEHCDPDGDGKCPTIERFIQGETMKVIKTDNCNMVYRGPEAGIGDLPCERRTVDGQGRTAIFSTWGLSDADRKAIAEGANVELGIYYVEPIPPVYVGLTTRQESKREPPPGPPNPPKPAHHQPVG